MTKKAFAVLFSFIAASAALADQDTCSRSMSQSEMIANLTSMAQRLDARAASLNTGKHIDPVAVTELTQAAQHFRNAAGELLRLSSGLHDACGAIETTKAQLQTRDEQNKLLGADLLTCQARKAAPRR